MGRYKSRSYQSRKTTEDSLKQENVGEKNGLFDSAILIAVITAIGYYLAYSYKKGYLSYYGVPENTINRVDIINIIVASTALFAILVVLISVYVNTNTIFYGVSHPVAIVFKNKIMPLIILWLLFINIMSDLILVWSIMILIWITWIYISPIFRYSSIKGYKNKLQKVAETNKDNGLMKKIREFFKSKSLSKYILLLLLTGFLGNVVTLIGTEEAKKERGYIIVEVEDVTYIVLDVAGDDYLITPYDEKTNSIKSKFSIVEIKSDFDDLLEFENIRLTESLEVEK